MFQKLICFALSVFQKSRFRLQIVLQGVLRAGLLFLTRLVSVSYMASCSSIQPSSINSTYPNLQKRIVFRVASKLLSGWHPIALWWYCMLIFHRQMPLKPAKKYPHSFSSHVFCIKGMLDNLDLWYGQCWENSSTVVASEKQSLIKSIASQHPNRD